VNASHDIGLQSILETIGNTPLIRLHRVSQGIRTPIYAKAEFFNPGGSVKDRIGLAIIEDAEKRGELKRGGVIVEGTSGNTGVGLALAAALKGYRCIFTMPDKMSDEKVRLLRAFGAEVVITPTAVPPDHPDNYVMKAKAIVQATPNAVLANQFYNQVNPDAHYRTTGPEIWSQTEGKVTHFVASAGTGGTLSGVGRFLREKNPKVRIIAGDPDGSIYGDYSKTTKISEGHPYKVEGIGGDKIPGTLHFDCVDEFVTVPDPDAFRMARRLAREEGIFVGGSSGLNVCVAMNVAREIDDPDACVVVLLPDTGERYLSKLFDDDWMRENQMLEAERATARTIRHGATGAQPHGNLQRVSAPGRGQRRECRIGGRTEGSLMARSISESSVLARTVRDVMEEPFPTVEADTPLENVVSLLSRETPAALVRTNGEFVGIVTRYDILHKVAGIR
jgi:cystathionine beta-synthase